ncbi:SagB/ThcOx family dehydrogenase [Chloroflexota bacterium]
MTDNARTIELPPPAETGAISVEEAIARRRSRRHFTPQPISLQQLSQLMWAAQGISDPRRGRRTVPSAGATFPLEIYVACGQNGADEIDAGIYHYDVAGHSLNRHHSGDIRFELAEAALGQKYIHQAPLNIIICALYERTSQRYGSRGERYVDTEIGHAGQNIYLEATALGLATVAIGAFQDELVSQALRLDRGCRPRYIMPVGSTR